MKRILSPMALGLALGVQALPATAQDPAAAMSLRVSEEFGPYLVSPHSRPVYVMLTESTGGDRQPPLESCNASCRADWPPVRVEAAPQAADGVSAELLDTATWRGDTVLRYAGQPLFHFVRDAPGSAPAGQGIHSYGGFWTLVAPDGTPIQSDVIPDRAVDGPTGQ